MTNKIIANIGEVFGADINTYTLGTLREIDGKFYMWVKQPASAKIAVGDVVSISKDFEVARTGGSIASYLADGIAQTTYATASDEAVYYWVLVGGQYDYARVAPSDSGSKDGLLMLASSAMEGSLADIETGESIASVTSTKATGAVSTTGTEFTSFKVGDIIIVGTDGQFGTIAKITDNKNLYANLVGADGTAAAAIIKRVSPKYFARNTVIGKGTVTTRDIVLKGAVSVANGDATVTGTDTAFDTELRVGDTVVINGVSKTVASITSATAFEANATYAITTSNKKATATIKVVPVYLKNMA